MTSKLPLLSKRAIARAKKRLNLNIMQSLY